MRESAGLFDLSHMGEIHLRGPQAGEALDHAMAGKLSAVAVGRAHEEQPHRLRPCARAEGDEQPSASHA